jgi:hypothetical protein
MFTIRDFIGLLKNPHADLHGKTHYKAAFLPALNPSGRKKATNEIL